MLFLIGSATALLSKPAGSSTSAEIKKYHYNWESLKTIPVPEWFDDAKFGIFIHWGPYSVIGHREGGTGYAEWTPRLMYQNPSYYFDYMERKFGAHPPEFGYKDIVSLFRAEKWDPEAWADLFSKAGARYVVLTAEHHDGFALWDSDLTPWCATKVGPMRDLVGDLGKAVRKRGMRYAPSYHRERHPGYFANPLYALRSTPFPEISEEIRRMPKAAELYGPFEYSDAFIDDYVARWQEIQEKYRPDFMWIDHSPVFHENWNKQANHPQIEKFRNACMRMIADYFNAAERWGKEVYLNNKGPEQRKNWPDGVGCREMDNYDPEYSSQKWQNAATMGTSYGYLDAEEQHDLYKSPTELIHLLCDVVSRNGNLLLNIGPKSCGTIPQGMKQRLLAMGDWLKMNGEAIYSTRPWVVFGQNSPVMKFTTRPDCLYAILFEPPKTPFVIQIDPAKESRHVGRVSLLATGQPLEWKQIKDGILITPPADWPGKHAWPIKIELTDRSEAPFKN